MLNKTKQEFGTTCQKLEKQHADFVFETNLAIASLEAKMHQITSKNAVAENRINQLEKQLQSLQQKDEISIQNYCSWLPISWDNESDVQPVTAVNNNSTPVLPVFVKMSGFDRYKSIRAR